MAKFVLLYFGDDERAQRYVDSTKAKVVGVYDDPRDNQCNCRGQKTPRNLDFGTGRQSPYHGWQTHRCGKAGVWWRRNYGRRLFLALGVNLLGDKAPAMMRSPQGWGHEAHKPEGVEQ